MNASSLSRVSIVALMSAGFLAMLVTAALHGFAVFSQPDPTTAGRKVIPAPSATRDQGAEASVNEALMAEVGQLMAKLKDNPNDSATLTILGDTFLRAGDWARAEVFLSRAVLSRPADIKARYMLGIAQHQQNKIPEAVKTFEELIAIEEDPAAMYNLAVIYKYQINDSKRARELFQKAAGAPGASPEIVEKAKNELE